MQQMNLSQKFSIIILFLSLTQSAISQPISHFQPKNETVFSQKSINFKWRNSTIESSYNFQLSNTLDFSSILFDSTLTNSNEMAIEVAYSTEKYYWRCKKSNESWSSQAISSFYNYSPTINSSLVLWYSPDSVTTIDNLIDTIFDLGPNNYHLYQLDANKMPSLVNVSDSLENPMIKFDGINDYLRVFFEDSVKSPFTIFSLWNLREFKVSYIFDNVLPHTSCFLGTSNPYLRFKSSGYLYHTQAMPFDYLLTSLIINGPNSKIYKNNSLMQTGNPGDASFKGMTLGASQYTGGFLNGEIGDLIIFDSVLSDNEFSLVQNYYYDKYFPGINFVEDINVEYGFCDTIVSAYKPWYKSYLWNTGETDSAIVVNSPGVYYVSVTDIFNRNTTDSIFVKYPQINLINDTTLCVGDEIVWETGLGTSYNFSWQGSLLATSAILINSQGEYSVRVTDTRGCELASDTVSVLVDNYTINIGPSDTALCAGNNIGLITGWDETVEYLWNDGSKDSIILIDTSGLYSVSTWNALGCQATDSINVEIVGIAPEILFSVSKSCLKEETFFNSLSPPQDSISIVRWIFNLTDTLYGVNISYTFLQSGENRVDYYIESKFGCGNDTVIKVFVNDIASLELPSVKICSNVPYTYQYDITIPDGQHVQSYSWYLNGTLIANDSIPQIIISEPDIYKILGEFELSTGCLAQDSSLIEVASELPHPESFKLIAPFDGEFIENDAVQFLWDKKESISFYLIQLSTNIEFSSPIRQEYSNSNSLIIDDLSGLNDTLFWRTIGFNYCNDSIISDINMLNFVTPFSFDNLLLGYNGDSIIKVNNAVNTLKNIAGLNNHLTQPIEASRPLISENYLAKPTISFDGVNDFMSGIFVDTLKPPYSIIVLWKVDESKYQACFDGILPEPRNMLSTSVPYLRYHSSNYLYYTINMPFNFIVTTLRINGNESEIYENGILMSTNNPGDSYFKGLTLGSSNTNNAFLSGEIASILFFDGLILDQQQVIENYLYKEYAPPVNLLYDITIPYGFADTTITTAEKPWFTSYQWSTSENDTLPTLTVSEPGTYAVTVTDIFGFESTDSLRVLYPEFTIPANTTLCLGDTLRWNLDAKGPYSYEWSTGESDMDIDLFEAGAYSVTITDTLGNQWSPEPVVITIDHFPATASLGADTTLCRGNRLQLQNGQSEAVGFLWSDGSTQPYYRIDQTETVTVQVTNALGCVAHDTIHIDVAGTAPVANFETGNLCRTYPVTFTNTSLALDGAEIESVLWNFNNQSTATTTHANYAFAQAGEVAITLTVNTNQGCTNDTTQTLRIHELPVSQFMPLQVCEGATLQLQNHSQSTDGEITEYTWQIANQWYNTAQPQHTFATAGSTFVQMVSRTEHNCPDTLETYITVKPAPVAAFSYDTICMGSEATFSNISTSQLGQQYTSQWHFADGSQSTTTHATHTFAQAGAETVKLIVKQLADGCTDTLQRTVQVHELPYVQLTDLQVCEQSTLNLTFDGSFGNGEQPGTVAWHVGDTSLQGTAVQYQAQSAATLTMQIVANNAAGCTTQSAAQLTIMPSPVVTYAALPDTVYLPTTLQPENQSEAAQFSWLVNGVEISTNNALSFPIDTAGMYIVKLTGTDLNGCETSHSDTTRAVVPLNDVGISQCRAIIDQGRLYVSVDLFNGGTKVVSNPEMRLILSNAQEFVEIYNGKLYPGKSTTYSFRAQYVLLPETTLDWITTEVHYSIDQQPANNSCTFVFGETIRIFAPYPNPATSSINLDLIAITDGQATLTMHNLMGKLVHQTTVETTKGLNRIEIANPARGGGIHTLEVKVGSQRQLFKIVL